MTDTNPEHVPVDHLPYARELVTRLPYAESDLREKISEGIGAASACWDNLAGAGVFKSEQASDIASRLAADVIELTGMGQPNLGCATTAQLLDEIRARAEVDGVLDYRTIGTSR